MVEEDTKAPNIALELVDKFLLSEHLRRHENWRSTNRLSANLRRRNDLGTAKVAYFCCQNAVLLIQKDVS